MKYRVIEVIRDNKTKYIPQWEEELDGRKPRWRGCTFDKPLAPTCDTMDEAREFCIKHRRMIIAQEDVVVWEAEL